ncbi:DUF6916 family protein [Litoribrevibacter albus]|uniref:DUF6916 domain-containing protein n=1 Tax=Litoribrevibacter albus TaxID=1473156 RepID=A0AA37W4K6_9GAMM|nr:hypothetical protein [Litoribrevibacter albus]GLQ30237.1 hypothetical protein GCM10007876_07150 [Litoribrevibacter albus]
MKTLTCADFAAHLNTTFTARIRDADPEAEIEAINVELELLKAEDRTNEQGERFSLIFSSPKETAVGQGCYPLQHDVMGEQSIFLVPVREVENSIRYEAVFNRLKS